MTGRLTSRPQAADMTRSCWDRHPLIAFLPNLTLDDPDLMWRNLSSRHGAPEAIWSGPPGRPPTASLRSRPRSGRPAARPWPPARASASPPWTAADSSLQRGRKSSEGGARTPCLAQGRCSANVTRHSASQVLSRGAGGSPVSSSGSWGTFSHRPHYAPGPEGTGILTGGDLC